MGQQQLLLLVLGIVIVGIAVVAGIQAFSEGKQKAAQDAAVSDAMRIISDVQAWKLKPSAFGGGSEATGFNGVNFKALGYPVDTDDQYMTTSGCYKLIAGGTASVELYRSGDKTTSDPDGTPGTGDETQTTTCEEATLLATVTVSGPTTEEITWEYN